MKKEMIRKRSAVSTAVALFTALMMALVMMLAGTLAVFADDNSMPLFPSHGQSGNQDAGWGNSEYSEQLSVGGGGISGTGDGSGHELKDWTADSGRDLSDCGDDGGIGNMYPPDPGNNDPVDDPYSPSGGGNDNNHEIDNTSADDGPGSSEDNQLSSGPDEKGGEPGAAGQPSETDKTVPDNSADTTAAPAKTDTGLAVTVAEGSGSRSDISSGPVSESSVKGDSDIPAAAGPVRAASGSPQTGDSNGLADAMTLLILSMACLAAMMHSRRDTESDMKGH